MNRYEFTSIVYDELVLDPDNRRVNRIIDAADEYAAGQAVQRPERASTALDHIHNVVAEREYQRGYEQGKAETNCPEIPDSWIPVTKEMPEEHDTMFAKYWGTDRWNKYMFRKRSDLVEVTVELDDGTRVTEASRTMDGKWAIEEEHGFVHKKVVAWKPMSAPLRGNVDAEVQNDKN